MLGESFSGKNSDIAALCVALKWRQGRFHCRCAVHSAGLGSIESCERLKVLAPRAAERLLSVLADSGRTVFMNSGRVYFLFGLEMFALMYEEWKYTRG